MTFILYKVCRPFLAGKYFYITAEVSDDEEDVNKSETEAKDEQEEEEDTKADSPSPQPTTEPTTSKEKGKRSKESKEKSRRKKSKVTVGPHKNGPIKKKKRKDNRLKVLERIQKEKAEREALLANQKVGRNIFDGAS